MPTKKPSPPASTTTDSDLFREIMKGVKPLKTDKIIPRIKPKKIIAAKPLRNATADTVMQINSIALAPVEKEATLSFRRPGIQHSVFKKLKQGQFSLQASLDLHGYTLVQAEELLMEFLQRAQERQFTSVHIIHGKGHSSKNPHPLLKNHMNTLLRQIKTVLAFCSALPKDGGTGAVYVLLKRV